MGGGSKKQKVGNRYYLGFVLIPCRQMDALVEVEMNDKSLWSGYAKDQRIKIQQKGAFGGDEREGGFIGDIDVQSGANDQAVNDYLLTVKGGLTSAMRGVCSLVFRQPYVSANTARLPKIRTRHMNVEGIHLGWEPDLATITPVVKIDRKAVFMVFDIGILVNISSRSRYKGALIAVIEAMRGGVNDLRMYGNQTTLLTPPYAGPQIYQGFNLSSDADYDAAIDWVNNVDRSGVTSTVNVVDLSAGPAFFGDPAEVFLSALLDDGEGEVSNKGKHILILNSQAPDGGAVADANANILAIGNVAVTAVAGLNISNDYPAVSGLSQIDNTTNGDVLASDDQTEINNRFLKAFVTWVDMNPAHMIRCFWIDPMRGGTVDAADIGDSFLPAAELFVAENFGLSAKFRGLDLADSDRKEIERHVDAVSYRSNRTGKIEIVPIRNDYVVGNLIVLDSSIVMDWSGLSRPRPSEVPNQLTVTYTRRDGKKGSVTRSNPAGVRRRGRVVKASPVSYPFCTTEELAIRLCLRDLRTVTSAILAGTIPLRYLPPNIECGSVIIINEPTLGFDNIVMRVSETRIGKSDDATAYITISEDKFATTQAVELAEVVTIDPSKPQSMPHRVVTEASYFQSVVTSEQSIVDADLADEPDLGQLVAAGAKANSYQLEATLATSTGGDWTDQGVIDFQPYGVLINDLSGTPTVTTFDITLNETLFEIGEGTLAVIGDEIIRIDNLVDNEDGTVTVTCGRGCLDGLPSLHVAGSYLLAIESAEPLDVDFIAGQSVSVKMLSRTGSDQQILGEVATDTVTFASRAIRPLPVGQFQVEGTYSNPASGSTGGTATWAHRDRTLQTTPDVADYLDSSIGPESGVSYTPFVKSFPFHANVFSASNYFSVEDYFANFETSSLSLLPSIAQVLTYEFANIKQIDFFEYADVFAQTDYFDEGFFNFDTALVGLGIRAVRDGYDNWQERVTVFAPLLPADISISAIYVAP